MNKERHIQNVLYLTSFLLFPAWAHDNYDRSETVFVAQEAA